VSALLLGLAVSVPLIFGVAFLELTLGRWGVR
jgi:hypothetical protein